MSYPPASLSPKKIGMFPVQTSTTNNPLGRGWVFGAPTLLVLEFLNVLILYRWCAATSAAMNWCVCISNAMSRKQHFTHLLPISHAYTLYKNFSFSQYSLSFVQVKLINMFFLQLSTLTCVWQYFWKPFFHAIYFDHVFTFPNPSQILLFKRTSPWEPISYCFDWRSAFLGNTNVEVTIGYSPSYFLFFLLISSSRRKLLK